MTNGYQENIAIGTDAPLYKHPDGGLRQGAFYWVNIIANDTQEGLFSDSWQPARYTGRAGDTVGDTWDFLGYYSATGHHDVEVVKVGPEIVPVL